MEAGAAVAARGRSATSSPTPWNGLGDAVIALRRRVAEEGNPAAALQLAMLEALRGEYDGAKEAAETAFLAFKAAGRRREAATAAGVLGKLYFESIGNHPVARGWYARGERLLATEGACPERGWLLLAPVGCVVSDAAELERRAREALALGEQFDDLPLQCKALADLGLALVSMGRIDEGLTRLDEALTLISTREVCEPWVVGQAACSLVSACERTGDLSRLDAWKSVIGTGSADDEVLLYFCHCRSAYGALLCQAGRWAEAESALRLAFGAAETTRYADHRARCRSALADLRIRQGRLEEASQLLRGLDDYVDAAHPRAHLHLARREPELAAAVLRRALRELGADRLRSAPLLLLLVEAELQHGDQAAATTACDRLDAVAAEVGLPFVQAQAALARGRLAARGDDASAAATAFEQGLCALSGEDWPLFRAALHLELARALSGRDKAAAVAEARAALAVFERVGAPETEDATALLRGLGVQVHLSRARPAGPLDQLSPREREVLELLGQGLSNPEIARTLVVSRKTVEHHVTSILGKLGLRSRAEAAVYAVTVAVA